MRKIFTSLFWVLALTASAAAQQGSLVQQSGTRLEAATQVAFAQAAAGSTSTATITVPAGQYAYITGVSMDTCADATGTTALANSSFTSTNIQSTPSWSISFAAAANTCGTRISEAYATPLKSLIPGTAVTVVSPATSAHNMFTIRVYFYLAP
jgi:hypothetical protein